MHRLYRFIQTSWRALRRIRRRQRLRAKLQTSERHRIVIGASGIAEVGWIATEVDQLDLLKPDDWAAFFRDDSIDAIVAEHVWEHLSSCDGALAARTCFRFLKPGGRLRVAVPDGLHPDPDYIERVRPQGSGPGADDHKVLYTHDAFRSVFEAAGFDVRMLEYFDESGEFRCRGWAPDDGMIHRSTRFDERNAFNPLCYTSIILDAVKPSKWETSADTKEAA